MKRRIRILTLIAGVSIGFYLLYLTLGKLILEEAKPDITSFILVHFAGYIFFIVSPVELLFIQFVGLHFDSALIVSLAVATAMLAQALDYAFGYFIKDYFIKDMIGEKKYEKTKRRLDKYNNIIIFMFNLLPLSSPIIMLVAGMLRYNFRNALIYSFAGLTIKYIILAMIF